MLGSIILIVFMLIIPGMVLPVHGQEDIVTSPQGVLDRNVEYYVYEDSYNNDVKIKMYLLKKDDKIANLYLDYTKEYLGLYEKLLGSFPYKSFSIVESKEEHGISLPGYAVFGSRVLRLPFIVETSLGHEILHQWFGAYVDVDYEKGNWSEGLTTYLSDYLYEEQKDKGSDYRKRVLVDYNNYVTAENEITLRDFRSRRDFATRTIGYGKSAMVFHMLRRKVGDEVFFNSLRRFIKNNAKKHATWDDIERAFEEVSGEKLHAFFQQWLERKGVWEFEITDISLTYRDGYYRLTLTVTQKKDIYDIDIPVRINFGEKDETRLIHLKERSGTFQWEFSERPLRVVIDPEYDVLRKLTEPEIPPVISAFTGNTDTFVIVPEGHSSMIEKIKEIFPDRKENILSEEDYKFNYTKDHSLLILYRDSSLFKRLYATSPEYDGDVLVRVYKNPLNSRFVVVLVDGSEEEQILSVLNRLKHYGNYSHLVFRKGRNILKETDRTDHGIVIDLSLRVNTVDIKRQPDFDEIIGSIKGKRLIYVGEMHTAYAHHLVQLEIIRRLFEENHSLMIGMEMFQRPFQEYIDMFINGEISEKEFLKKTEYFKRWSFNYNLYRDILHFARENRIPVFALNIKKEIIEKVSKDGLDGLTEEEKKLIPDEIDMTNNEYRDRLKDVFRQHRNSNKKDFDNFYIAQLLWDETMARSIVEALKKHPDRQMVVIAGNGHLQNSWGIPSRVSRLMDVDHTIILNSPGEEISKGLAHYVLYPSFVPAPESPKLGVFTEETEKGLEIKKVMEGSPAEKAGIKEGDILFAIDDSQIKGLDDLKVFLLDKKKGDLIRVKVRRGLFIFGSEDISLDLIL